MEERAEDLVKTWFSQSENFRPSGKSESSVARRLINAVNLAGKDVLNMGCFYPEDELEYGGKANSWTAIDLCEPVIKWCLEIKDMPSQVIFLQKDIRATGFSDNSFDIVCDFSTGDHLTLQDFVSMIKEAHRVLRPSGLFLCSYQNATYFVGEPLEHWRKDAGYSRSMTTLNAGLAIQSVGFYILQSFCEIEPCAGLLAQKK